jgi:hypothetical protein
MQWRAGAAPGDQPPLAGGQGTREAEEAAQVAHTREAAVSWLRGR